MEEVDHYQKHILKNLEQLNKRLASQSSFGTIFWTGVLYGIGFFVGSAIIATIALGILGPFFAEVPWIHSSFEAGSQLLHH